ncbi:MAG TPA: hypothetical protein VND64_20560 [Pirellulales bacterium]|nr:hypothetical protein [Pirellulales bacterium]
MLRFWKTLTDRISAKTRSPNPGGAWRLTGVGVALVLVYYVSPNPPYVRDESAFAPLFVKLQETDEKRQAECQHQAEQHAQTGL